VLDVLASKVDRNVAAAAELGHEADHDDVVGAAGAVRREAALVARGALAPVAHLVCFFFFVFFFN
jgi:hypothetical protein